MLSLPFFFLPRAAAGFSGRIRQRESLHGSATCLSPFPFFFFLPPEGKVPADEIGRWTAANESGTGEHPSPLFFLFSPPPFFRTEQGRGFSRSTQAKLLSCKVLAGDIDQRSDLRSPTQPPPAFFPFFASSKDNADTAFFSFRKSSYDLILSKIIAQTIGGLAAPLFFFSSFPLSSLSCSNESRLRQSCSLHGWSSKGW